MTVKMILATDRNWGIGKNNSLPWKFPEDLQYFKECTEASNVLMGSSTYKSLPFKNGLPNRANYVLTRNVSCKYKVGINFINDFDYMIPKLIEYVELKKEDLWVIGGASIYQQMLPYVEEIHHTLIQGDYDCDTFFNLDFLKEGEWSLESSKPLCDNADVMVWKRRNDG